LLDEAADYIGSYAGKKRGRMLLSVAAEQFNAGSPAAAATLESGLKAVSEEEEQRKSRHSRRIEPIGADFGTDRGVLTDERLLPLSHQQRPQRGRQRASQTW
jgi:hypothetical protein